MLAVSAAARLLRPRSLPHPRLPPARSLALDRKKSPPGIYGNPSKFRTMLDFLPAPAGTDPDAIVTSPAAESIVYDGGSGPGALIHKVEIMAPASKNALTPDMMVELEDAVKRCEKEAPSFLVITGAGGTFCSGANIRMAKEAIMPDDQSTDGGQAMAEHMTFVLNRLRDCSTISVAAIDGAAYGGGAELATACDFRVMSPGARIKHVQSKMGVTTGWGGGRRLAEIVGRRNALRMLTFGETVDVDMAVRWGLCDYVTPEDETAATFIENLIREEFPRTASPVTRSWKAVVDAKSEREEIDLFTTHWNQPAHRFRFDEAMNKK